MAGESWPRLPVALTWREARLIYGPYICSTQVR